MEFSTIFIVYIIPLLALAVLVMIVAIFLRRPVLTSLDLKVLSIKIGRKYAENKEDPKSFLHDINLMEQLLISLSSIRKPFVFELAVENRTEDINFYLAVPRSSLEFTKRQIQGLFLDAEVKEAHEYNIFAKQGESMGGYLSLAESDLLPIRTYREAEVDSFAPILSTLSKLKEDGDGAAIQLVVMPATEADKKRVVSSLDKLKDGFKKGEVFKRPPAIKEIFQILFSNFSKEKEKRNEPKVLDEEAIKALQLKISKPLLAVNVRMVASSNDQGRAEEIFLSISGAFSQFSATMRNSFNIIVPKKIRKLYFAYAFREYKGNQRMLLNSEEIASLIHIPTNSSDIPRIAWLRTKEVTPPANLPTEGTILGENIFREERKLVRLTDADRRRHLYIIGQTGVGKSYKLLAPMIIQDIDAGKGVCLIDPHGDLVDVILERIPQDRLDDVVIFDPGDLRRPLGLNMLEYDLTKPEEKTFIVSELINIFNSLYDLKATGGPMFEYYLRNALLLMLGDASYEPATLLDVPRIFSDNEYRNQKLSRCKDPLVVNFWTKEASKATGEQGLGNITPYVVSKFSSFISNDYVRPIVGQAKSSFNIRDLMDNQKILLVKLAKGKIGDLNASLLGMIITSRILMSALGRSDIKVEDRKDFCFYIDEFQNFTTDSIATILSESRKYGLCLTVAHQFIAQLKDEIREAVFGNVGSMVSFRVGDKDAETLSKQFGPEFSEKDLISIENNRALIKLLINGEPARPFSLNCLSPRTGYPELKSKLEELSRLTYGRELAEVEAEIVKKLTSEQKVI